LSIYAYLRVSTADQDIEAQRREIEGYCSRKDLQVDEWLEIEMSSRKSQRKRRIEELLGKLRKDDALIVSELSRLGRSISEVVLLVESLIRRKVSFTAIKENIVLNGRLDIQAKVMIAMFGLFAEVERDLISQRTKMGLANARAKGVRLGNPNLPKDNEIRRKNALGFAESLRSVLEGFVSRGMSQRSILLELNRLGVKTRRGGEWSLAQLQIVLDRLQLKTCRARA
jgi:DNA invertase Pin-like site-specific DNA recombinase